MDDTPGTRQDRLTSHYLRLLVDSVPSMLAYWDRDLNCRFANRAYETWFGANPDALLGTSIRDLLGPTLFAMNEPHIRAALRGEPQTFERVVPGPDNAQRYSLAQYIPHRIDDEVLGFIVQVTEITRLKEAEAALQHEKTLRKHIEQHARELGALLHEREEVMAVLAHEVRQPLHNAAAVLHGAAKALTGRVNETHRATLQRAQAVLGEVLGSVDNTLAVATLVARNEQVHPQDTDIDMLVAIAIGDMPQSLRERVRVERHTGTRTASMDHGLMRLALRNLLINALQYSPAAAPVTVRLSDSDEPLALVFDVIDQGPGIERDFIPHLFERGTRGNRTRQSAGHGLGLFIVRRVMELHGGSATLLQTSKAGTTMRLVVPQ
jgi:PAS domain S-box-containing protein